jgi:hypothetical protein
VLVKNLDVSKSTVSVSKPTYFVVKTASAVTAKTSMALLTGESSWIATKQEMLLQK